MSLFFDFKDWILTLIDNLLILCHMYDNGMDKLRKVRDRCNECNVVLKFSKSTFGYQVQDGKWCQHDDRKQTVTDTPMPTDLKEDAEMPWGWYICIVSLYRTMRPSQPNYST